MLNIHSILKEVLKDLQASNGNVIIVDDKHIIDNVSGVEFHLYDDYFQMTRGSDEPVSVSSFTDAEKATVMKLKDAITDPVITKDKRENYQQYITESRLRLSTWFENPEPKTDGVVEETDTIEYNR